MKIIALWNNYEDSQAGKPSGISAYGPLQIPATVWMTDSCLLRERKPFFIPEFDNEFRLFPTVAIKLSRLGKNIPRRFASRYWQEASVWINVRACGMMKRLESQGCPLAASAAYDNSIVSAPFFPLEEESLSKFSFTMMRNDEPVMQWTGRNLLLGADASIEAVSRNTILKTGDVLMLGFDNKGVEISRGDTISIVTDSLRDNDEPKIITVFSIK